MAATPRAKNDPLLKTEALQLSLNVVVLEYLDRLVKSGRFGNKPSDAARVLLSRAIDEMVLGGSLKAIDYDERHRTDTGAKAAQDEE